MSKPKRKTPAGGKPRGPKQGAPKGAPKNRGIMFTIDSLLVKLPKRLVSLTVRMKDPGKPVVVKEPVQLVARTDRNYTVEYRDGSKRLIEGKPPDSLRVGVWTFAMYMPMVCARLFIDTQRVEKRRLSTMDDDQARLAGFKDLAEYRAAWEKLNNKDGQRWLDDPEVFFCFFTVRAVAQ